MARQEQAPFVVPPPRGGARAQGRVTADPSRSVPLIDTLHLTCTAQKEREYQHSQGKKAPTGIDWPHFGEGGVGWAVVSVG